MHHQQLHHHQLVKMHHQHYLHRQNRQLLMLLVVMQLVVVAVMGVMAWLEEAAGGNLVRTLDSSGKCASGFKAVRDLQLQTLSFEIFNDAAFAGGLAPSFLGATQPSG